MTFKYRGSKLDLSKTLYKQGPVIIERLPSGKLDACQTVELLDIPDRPQRLVCDCCLASVDRLWIRNHRGFCLPEVAGVPRQVFFAGYWAFCVYCWPLFEQRDLKTLVARVSTLNPELYAPGLAILHATLAECVWGDLRTWEAGQPRLKLEAE